MILHVDASTNKLSLKWMTGVNVCRWIMGHEPDEMKIGRENFGVWQLPLFNHLKPECRNGDNFWAFEAEED